MQQVIVSDETGQRWIVTEHEPLFQFLQQFTLPSVPITIPRHFFMENDLSPTSITSRPRGYFPTYSKVALSDSDLQQIMTEEIYLLIKGASHDYNNTYRIPSARTVLLVEERTE